MDILNNRLGRYSVWIISATPLLPSHLAFCIRTLYLVVKRNLIYIRLCCTIYNYLIKICICTFLLIVQHKSFVISSFFEPVLCLDDDLHTRWKLTV